MNTFAIADPLSLADGLSDDERQVLGTTAAFVDREILPLIADAFESGRFPRELVRPLGDLGLLGAPLSGWGCAGMGQTAYGLALMELERGDSGLRSFASVQGSLVMWPIHTYGSDEQKDRWLPGLRSGERIGCFGLTEPESGSDPASLRTRARRDGDDWILDGSKLWITNGTLADVALVWAKAEGLGEGAASIRGFLVDTTSPGFSATEIPQKLSLRASTTASLHLDGVRVPQSAMLPGAQGLRGPLSCLNQARFGIAFGAVGALAACFESARDYAKTRVQFGRPIGSKQLVQAKLADMYTDLGHAQLTALRLGRLKDEGKLKPAQVSFAKRANVDAALRGARIARDIHGANGVTLAYPPIRHLLNLETVRTYEGTHDIHTLVLGREITGLDAF